MTTTARPQVFLHIGAAKSGTTYLQRKLWHNREALRRDGFCYPGEQWYAHVWATHSLRRMRTGPNFKGAWYRLVSELREFDGPGIIDQELLSQARPQQIKRALDDLDWADVHIVFTLRDMARTLPAAWQERVKNQQLDSFAEFLEIVHLPYDERMATGNRFWGLHDTPEILKKWSEHVPADHVHIVTLPQSGGDPDALWNRFANVLGVEAARYEDPPVFANTSLSAPAAAALRRINVAINAPEYPKNLYSTVVKHYLAPELAGHKGPAIALPPHEYDWAVDWSKGVIDFIKTAGYDVVGDLDELLPGPARPGVDPDAVDVTDQADLGFDTTALLLTYLARQQRRRAKQRHRGQSGNARKKAVVGSRPAPPEDSALRRTVKKVVPASVRAKLRDR